MEYLKQIVSLLENFPTTKMKINGHTDNVGTEEYNVQLSKNRALAVYNYLISQGIKSERLSYAYFGTKYPVSSNDTEEGRRNNRRVEFEMQNKK
jgi:OOP family OmpA-OmpF porin